MKCELFPTEEPICHAGSEVSTDPDKCTKEYSKTCPSYIEYMIKKYPGATNQLAAIYLYLNPYNKKRLKDYAWSLARTERLEDSLKEP